MDHLPVFCGVLTAETAVISTELHGGVRDSVQSRYFMGVLSLAWRLITEVDNRRTDSFISGSEALPHRSTLLRWEMMLDSLSLPVRM